MYLRRRGVVWIVLSFADESVGFIDIFLSENCVAVAIVASVQQPLAFDTEEQQLRAVG